MVVFDYVKISVVNWHSFIWCHSMHKLIFQTVKMHPGNWSTLLKHNFFITLMLFDKLNACTNMNCIEKYFLRKFYISFYIWRFLFQPFGMATVSLLSVMERRNCNKLYWLIYFLKNPFFRFFFRFEFKLLYHF